MSQRFHKHLGLHSFAAWGASVCAVVLGSFAISHTTLSADDSFGRSLPPSLVESSLMDQLMSSAPTQINLSPDSLATDRLEARRAAVQVPTPGQGSQVTGQGSQRRQYRVGQAFYAAPSDREIGDREIDNRAVSRPAAGEPALQHPSPAESRFDPKESFIQREQASRPQAQASGSELIRRLGVNLIFVLACALGVLLVIKQWQTGRGNSPAKSSVKEGSISISQVHKLAHGASLHVVEVIGNQFLVAMDSTGIRSVKPLVQEFGQTPDYSNDHSNDIDRQHPSTRPEPVVHDESTAEIDENLIRLLLNSSKRAA